MKTTGPARPPDALGVARARAGDLLHTARSLILGTIDAAGMPLVSNSQCPTRRPGHENNRPGPSVRCAGGGARPRGRPAPHGASLIRGTIDAAGMPLVSYAPFAQDDSGDLLIAVSALAAHQPALATADRVSVMLIEDEAATRQIFARTRLTLDCQIKPSPGLARHEVFAVLRGRFGEIADLLEGLGDFHAYRLTPRRGQFVTGFGAAFVLPDGRIDTMEPVGVDSIPGGRKA